LVDFIDIGIQNFGIVLTIDVQNIKEGVVMKNILVVGSSSGIGSSVAQVLSDRHTVYGTYYKTTPSDTTSSYYLNVLDDAPDFSFLPETLDGLVYCPGAINLKAFSRTKVEDFIADYQLQVLGAVKVIQACLPALKRSEQASIVLFSTVAVKMGFGFHSIVASSKGAIEGLTTSLAAEFAPKIRVNCIAPSITNTPLASHLLNTAEKMDASAQRHPLKKIGTPEDIANAVAFLIGDHSQWMTGQVLHIDGGMSSVKLL